MPPAFDPDARIFIAGHRGLLGRALVRRLERAGHTNLLLARREQLDLTCAEAVLSFFESSRPDYVFLAAARVGGIAENQRYPAEFIQTNLRIETSVLEAAHRTGVRGLVLFCSSCMYPRDCRQPMREGDLWSGPLEPTSRPYAVAKLSGLELCRAYRQQHGRRFFAMLPPTLYGPHDHFQGESGHVMPQLLRRFHEAVEGGLESVTVLGSGRPRREFLHCDDAADAAVFLMGHSEDLDLINVGWGRDIAIAELAELISEITGFDGRIAFDPGAPDGASVKRLDVSRMRTLGWEPSIDLRSGLAATYDWFKEGKSSLAYS
jgi:GDP-L-fucose synthase